ncbi:MAG: hypothetical protein AAFV43_02645 [Planctomycetota bacterium]
MKTTIKIAATANANAFTAIGNGFVGTILAVSQSVRRWRQVVSHAVRVGLRLDDAPVAALALASHPEPVCSRMARPASPGRSYRG